MAWIDIYLTGKISADRLPNRVRDVLRAWFDGTRSAMYQISWAADPQPINPRKLFLEIMRCMKENNQGCAETVKLQIAQQWVEHELRLATSAKALRQAALDFANAANNAKLDAYDQQALFDAAITFP